MNIDLRCDDALRATEPLQALRALAIELISEGADQARLLELFEVQRARLREVNRDADEDAVLDAMDFIAGWCSPQMKLFPVPVETTMR